jgi:hypothetical protein
MQDNIQFYIITSVTPYVIATIFFGQNVATQETDYILLKVRHILVYLTIRWEYVYRSQWSEAGKKHIF